MRAGMGHGIPSLYRNRLLLELAHVSINEYSLLLPTRGRCTIIILELTNQNPNVPGWWAELPHWPGPLDGLLLFNGCRGTNGTAGVDEGESLYPNGAEVLGCTPESQPAAWHAGLLKVCDDVISHSNARQHKGQKYIFLLSTTFERRH